MNNKRKLLSSLFISAFLLVPLTACTSNGDLLSKIEELENKINKIEQENEEFKDSVYDKFPDLRPTPEPTPEPEEIITEKDLYTISYNLSDPNMARLWKPGLQEASVAQGFNQIKVEDAKCDDGKALSMVKAAALKDYGAYLINIVDHSNGRAYLDILKETDKPVIFWNREPEHNIVKNYDKAYYVGVSPIENGCLQGAMAAEYVNKVGFDKVDRNGDGKLGVIVVRGEKAHLDAEARTRFSPMYLERNLEGGNAAADGTVSGNTYKYEGTWNKVDVKSIVDGTDITGVGWDPVTASMEVGRVLAEKKDEIDLVLSNSDGMALGIITNKEFQKAGIPIWGVDALSDALFEIKKPGTQFKGTVKNDGVSQAKVCVAIAKNLIEGKRPGEGLTVVSTVEEWEKNDQAIWYDEAQKAFRVHLTKITVKNA